MSVGQAKITDDIFGGMDTDAFMDLSVSERMRIMRESEQHRKNKRNAAQAERECKYLGT